MSTQEMPTEITDLNGFDLAVRFALVPKVVKEASRLVGEQPISLVEVGLWRRFRRVTTVLEDGEEDIVFLTENAAPRGENVFSSMPSVTVLRDVDNDAGGLAKADGPAASNKELNLAPHLDYEIGWSPVETAYFVTVRNTTGQKTSFHVEARGI